MLAKKDVALLGPPSDTLYLVDISSFIFRAFFAIRMLNNSAGEPLNAVLGVASMLAKLVEVVDPKYLVICFDSKESGHREELYADYKANRSEAPEDLVPQFAHIESLIEAMQIPSFRLEGVEADDLIATLAKSWTASDQKNRVVVVSGDKDLMQLVNERVLMLDTMKEKIFDRAAVFEKFQVYPEQIQDYLSMVGDSSDNIPGVPSVGPKTAADLIAEFGNLESILKAAQAGKIKGKKGEVLSKHEAEARISHQLVELKSDLPLKWQTESLKYQFRVNETLEKLLRQFEFTSILRRWHEIAQQKSGAALTAADSVQNTPGLAASIGSDQGSAIAVQDEERLIDLLKQLDRCQEFAVDLETTSLNPRAAEIVGIALSLDPSRGYYIPVGHREGRQLPRDYVLRKLKPYLSNPRYKKLGQNLKYDMSVFKEQGVTLDGIGADTMIAAYLLDSSSRHNLDLLAQRYLGHETIKYEDLCGKGKDQITFDQVPIDKATLYSAEDAFLVQRLWKKFLPLLEAQHLTQVFSTIELPLIPVLCEMESHGIAVDLPWLQKLSSDFAVELAAIEKKIQAHSKSQKELNLNSPRQLAQLLFEDLGLPTQGKTKTGYSTDASVLEKLSRLHEVPALIVEYREIAKLKSTYVDPLPTLIDPKTSRIHGSFHQTVAATGRLSSSDPNLQNIPIRTERGQMIRRAFVPRSGEEFLSVDYSQMELRILAEMSGDAVLVESFQRDEDVHSRTASELFSVQIKDVNSEQRAVAKAINFGLMYGKTPWGLAQELGISNSEAKEMIDRYFKRYAGVKKLLDGQVEEARENGFVMTYFGRRRALPDIRSKNPTMRGFAERMAMNTPIQGTAADMMKLAMIRLHDRMMTNPCRSHLLVQVHDELLLECPRDEIQTMREWVTEAMEKAVEFKVPMKTQASRGKNWMELEDWE